MRPLEEMRKTNTQKDESTEVQRDERSRERDGAERGAGRTGELVVGGLKG